MEHDGADYIGCLFFDDAVFCAQISTTLEKHAGCTIKEIGDLDLSLTL